MLSIDIARPTMLFVSIACLTLLFVAIIHQSVLLGVSIRFRSPYARLVLLQHVQRQDLLQRGQGTIHEDVEDNQNHEEGDHDG